MNKCVANAWKMCCKCVANVLQMCGKCVASWLHVCPMQICWCVVNRKLNIHFDYLFFGLCLF